MKLEEVLKPEAWRNRHGVEGREVNTAVYAVPHVVDEGTVAWGMTDGRTWDNVRQNPMRRTSTSRRGKVFAERGSPCPPPDRGFREMLAKIRQRTAKVSPGNPEA